MQVTTLIESDFVSQDGDVILPRLSRLDQGDIEHILSLGVHPLIASQAVQKDEMEEISPAGPDGSKPATSSVYPMNAGQDFHAGPEKAESISSTNGSEHGAVAESEVHSNIQRAPTSQMHVLQTSRAHEIAQRLASQVFTDRDEPLTTSVQHDNAQQTESFTDTLEKALDFLAAALWRPPQGLIQRGAQAPSAHHPLAISKAGPIFPERGLRVVLTAEYNLRKNNLLMTSRPNCCLEYAHHIRFSFGPHLNKTFKEVYENHPAYETFCRTKRAQGPYMKEFLLYCNYCKGYIEVKPKVPNAGLAVRLGPPDSLTMRSEDPNVKPIELPLCPLHGTGSITDIGPESVSCRVLWDSPEYPGCWLQSARWERKYFLGTQLAGSSYQNSIQPLTYELALHDGSAKETLFQPRIPDLQPSGNAIITDTRFRTKHEEERINQDQRAVGTHKKKGDGGAGGAGAVKEDDDEEEEGAKEALESDKQEILHKLEVMTEESTKEVSESTKEVSANKHAGGVLLQEVAGNKVFASENAELTSKIEMLTDKCEKDAAGQKEEGDGGGGAVKKEGKVEEQEEEALPEDLLAELKRARDNEVRKQTAEALHALDYQRAVLIKEAVYADFALRISVAVERRSKEQSLRQQENRL